MPVIPPIETVQAPRVASGTVALSGLTPAVATTAIGLPPGAAIRSFRARLTEVSNDGNVAVTLTAAIAGGATATLVNAQDVKGGGTGDLTVVPYEGGPIAEASTIDLTLAGNGDGTKGLVFIEVDYIIDGRADEVYG